MARAASGDDRASRQALEWHIRLQEIAGDDEAHAAFADWLAEDPAHGQAWEELEDVLGLMSRPMPELAASSASSRTSLLPQFVPLAALAVILAFILLPLTSRHMEADYVTGTGDIRHIPLADSSLVVLNAASALDIRFDSRERRAHLISGEAFFRVSQDSRRPFHLIVGNIEIVSGATDFDVRVTKEETDIRVQNGRVDVFAAGRSAHVGTLKSGDWRCLTPEGETTMAGKSDPEAVASWIRGLLVVQDWKVVEALREFKHHYKGIIIMAAGGLAEQRVSGTFDLARPHEGLRDMLVPLGASVYKITPWVLLVV